MDALFTELAAYGPTGLFVAGIIFLLRNQIADLIRGSSADTAKLIAAIEENSQGLKEMSEQFEHNKQLFTGVTHTAAEMVQVLRAIEIEIIKGAK